MQACRREFESERARKKISPDNLFFENRKGNCLVLLTQYFDGEVAVFFFLNFRPKSGGMDLLGPPLTPILSNIPSLFARSQSIRHSWREKRETKISFPYTQAGINYYSG